MSALVQIINLESYIFKKLHQVLQSLKVNMITRHSNATLRSEDISGHSPPHM